MGSPVYLSVPSSSFLVIHYLLHSSVNMMHEGSPTAAIDPFFKTDSNDISCLSILPFIKEG